MEKPKSVKYGITLLYVSASLLTVWFLSLFYGLEPSISNMFFIVILPATIVFYLIYLLSKGKFWVRSILLALTIIDVIKFILGFFFSTFGSAIIMLPLLIASIWALRYLYTKEASAWYAHLLMEETTKRLAERKKAF